MKNEKLLSIKSHFLYRLFQRKGWVSIDIIAEPSLLLHSKLQNIFLELDSLKDIQVDFGYFFSTINIITSSGEVHKIKYIPKRFSNAASEWLELLKIYGLLKSLNDTVRSFYNGTRYVSFRDDEIFFENNIIANKHLFFAINELEKVFDNFKFSKTFQFLSDYKLSPEAVRVENNEKFMENEPVRQAKFFEGLNDKQIEAVITNEDNVMVVAGAGSGKTKVIESKVNYLVEKLNVPSKNILILAFNKDAVSELQDRVVNIPKMNIKTFHSLGNRILNVSEKESDVIDCASDNAKYTHFIKNLLLKVLDKKPLLSAILLYFKSFYYKSKNPYSFTSMGEYNSFIQENKIITLKNEVVKSFGEVDIANFLYLHKIDYFYEKEYEEKYEKSFEYGTYRPDFTIPATKEHPKIYIEYFGIDEQGNTLKGIEKDKYAQSILWKQSLHDENNTILISLYAYQKRKGRLLSILKRKLKKYNVKCNELLPVEERLKVLNEINGIDDFSALLTRFLVNYKANNHRVDYLWKSLNLRLAKINAQVKLLFSNSANIDQVTSLEYEINHIKRKLAFLKIFNAVYCEYEKYLKESKKYDFLDMIVKASDEVYNCYLRKIFDYKYILVDEFQDISRGRSDFIKKLIALNPDSKWFVVGDDWQSINRFAGSDLSIMLNFEDVFSENNTRKSKIIKLDKVYRFNDSISDVASKFIQQNPNQMKKDIIAKPATQPSVLVWYADSSIYAIQEIINHLFIELNHSQYYEDEANKPPEILILGRYNRTTDNEYGAKLLHAIKNLKKEYKDYFEIEYKTIHKSKGLGKDYVIILDLEQGAFPVSKEDDPILDMVMGVKESFADAEERRLFYVALTRAKNKVYLVSNSHPSCFLNELTNEANQYKIFVANEPEGYASKRCPVCEIGLMVKPYSDKDKFYYCQNRMCMNKAPTCPICGKGFLYKDEDLQCVICSNSDCNYVSEECPNCGGILLHRQGEFGPFIGCSNFRGQEELTCANIIKVERCVGCNNQSAYLYNVLVQNNKIVTKCSDKNCRRCK